MSVEVYQWVTVILLIAILLVLVIRRLPVGKCPCVCHDTARLWWSMRPWSAA
jgi:hypothetical protein